MVPKNKAGQPLTASRPFVYFGIATAIRPKYRRHEVRSVGSVRADRCAGIHGSWRDGSAARRSGTNDSAEASARFFSI